jgi:DNA-binding NarL/FixJ family response regulator
MTRIVVVDDHTIIRQGLTGLLRGVEEFEVVAEAGTGAAAVRFVLDINPDIVIMDMSLPDMDGLEAVRQMKENGFGGHILFLTMHNDQGYYEAAQRLGVSGYLLKDDAMDDLVYAIKAVLRGDRFTSGALNVTPPARQTAQQDAKLTHRENEIVTLIAGGNSSKEIAEKFCISVKTVETHRSNIMHKLGLKGASDLTKYAIRVGLI